MFPELESLWAPLLLNVLAPPVPTAAPLPFLPLPLALSW